MKKIEELKALVEKEGSEAMKSVVLSAEKYIEGLKKVFTERPVSNAALEIDLPMFFRELEEDGTFEGMEGMEIKLYMMNVLYVARHTWELVDGYGQTKTGDDLRKAWPLMFEDDEMLSIEDLFKNMGFMIQ